MFIVAATGCQRSEEAAAPEIAPDPLTWDETTTFDLGTGQATLGCEATPDPTPVPDPEYKTTALRVLVNGLGVDELRQQVRACARTHTIHLDYRGSMHRDFAVLIRVLSDLAEEAGVPRRILDADSSGGDVVSAMHAGDVMGDRDWAMRVREGAVCNSACVMLLAAARYRVVEGDVGIHRVFASRSQATSREELARDLESIVERIRSYLVKHGASAAITDAMMTVPAREIRLLGRDELEAYGLLGPNPAQEDLERVKLVQRCGMDFVRRSEGWASAFETECAAPAAAAAETHDVPLRSLQCQVVECGLRLQERFGFPDATCTGESPITRTGAWLLCDQRQSAARAGG